MVGVMVPLGAILGYALSSRKTPLDGAVTTAVAGIVTLIPEGLILLTSVTYAVAALRMARRGALAQQLNAIESLASAEMVCLDKTGTLTEAALEVAHGAPAAGSTRRRWHALGYAASAGSKPTLDAIAAAFPAEASRSASPLLVAAALERRTDRAATYVLGAPELFPLGALAERAWTEQEHGRRVVASETTVDSRRGRRRREAGQEPPRTSPPLGLVVLGERLRPDARARPSRSSSQGVQLKVLSGDAPGPSPPSQRTRASRPTALRWTGASSRRIRLRCGGRPSRRAWSVGSRPTGSSA